MIHKLNKPIKFRRYKINLNQTSEITATTKQDENNDQFECLEQFLKKQTNYHKMTNLLLYYKC